MKNYYCFYCQQEIKPFWWFFRRVCPHCGCYLTDNGNGFYKVCDKCHSNLPTDAAVCMICGYHFSGENARKVYYPEASIFYRPLPKKAVSSSKKAASTKTQKKNNSAKYDGYDDFFANIVTVAFVIIMFIMTFVILLFSP